MERRGSLYIGLLMITFGGVFLLVGLLRQLEPLGISLGWHNLWPLLVLSLGMAFWLPLMVWWPKRAELAGLAVPASILTVNGLILLYQSLTGDWASWAYMWALEPVALGLAFLIMYYLMDGANVLRILGIAFVGIGGFFFLMFATAFSGLLSILGPLILIALGLLLLLRGRMVRQEPFRMDE